MDLLKTAILNPLIKELDEMIDKDVLKNYRPVSNLTFLSKLIERVVAVGLESHMNNFGLHSNKQFGYKKNHSTEVLLLKIMNNLLASCDKKVPTVLLLLDLSTAFDTVDQKKLLKILHDEIGIRDINRTRSFANNVDSIGFDVGGFADDHQLWKAFSIIFQMKALGQNLNECFNVISSWMNDFFL